MNKQRLFDLLLLVVFGALFALWGARTSSPVAAATPEAELLPQPVSGSAVEYAGGPDAFGYIYRDSREPNGPVYNWEDIAATGTLAQGWNSYFDGYAGAFPIGFEFPFYGETQTQFYISSNGYISFGSGSSDILYSLPSTTYPNHLIAPLGFDLYLHDYGNHSAVYYQTLSNPTRLVVQFNNLHYCCYYNQPRTFQLILYPTGRIVMQYQTLSQANYANAIGIEDQQGMTGLNYLVNGMLEDGLAIEFKLPIEAAFTQLHTEGMGLPGETIVYSLTLQNGTGMADQFNLSLLPGAQWTVTLPVTRTAVISDGNHIQIPLHVEIPLNALHGESDTVQVQATSVTSPTVFTATAQVRTVALDGEMAFGLVIPNPGGSPPDASQYYLLGRDVATQQILSVFSRPEFKSLEPNCMALAPSGEIWLACADNGSLDILVVDAKTSHITQIPLNLYSFKIKISPDGAQAVVLTENGLAVIDTATYTITHMVNLPGYWATDLAYNARTAKWYVLVPDPHKIYEVDPATWTITHQFSLSDFPSRLTVSSDGTTLYVATVGSAFKVHRIDLPTFQIVQTVEPFANGGYANEFLLTHDGSYLLLVGSNWWYDAITILDANTLETVSVVQNINQSIQAADLTCDGNMLWVAAYDKIYTFDTQTFTLQSALPNPDVNGDGMSDQYLRDIVVCPAQLPAPAVFLTTPVNAQQAGRGEAAAYALQFANYSGITDTYTITLNSNWAAQVSIPQTFSLTHGSALTFTAVTTVPLDADWYSVDALTVTVTSASQPQIFSDTLHLFTEVYAPPALNFAPASFSVTPIMGQAITQTLVITNGPGVTLTFELDEYPSLGRSATNPVQILTLNADTTPQSFANVLQALDDQNVNYVIDELQASPYPYPYADSYVYPNLAAYDVLLVAGEQNGQSWTLYNWGSTLRDILQDFVFGGGRVVVLDSHYRGIGILDGANLMDLGWYGSFAAYPVPVEVQQPNHLLANQVAPTFETLTYSNAFNPTNADNIVAHTANNGHSVAAQRQLGQGSVTLLSFDFTEYNSNMARLLANAIVPPGAGDIPWLTVEPSAGSVQSNTSSPATLTFDSAGLQPGTYSGNLRLGNNAPGAWYPMLPLQMNVEPGANMGWLEGYVSDAFSTDALRAAVGLTGQSALVYSDPNTGYYKLWLDAGVNEVQFAAIGYLTHTVSLSITAQQGAWLDAALIPNVPVAQVQPQDLAAEVTLGQTQTQFFTVTNAGPAPLTFKLLGLPEENTRQPLQARRALVWHPYSSNAYDVTLLALATYAPNLVVDNTQTTDLEVLSLLIPQYEVFIIANQDNAGYYAMYQLGQEFSQVINDYLAHGGIVIGLESVTPGASRFLQGAGVTTTSWYTMYDFGQWQIVLPDHPIVANVPAEFFVAYSAMYTNVDGNVLAVSRALPDKPTLVHKPFGAGHIILLGFDFSEGGPPNEYAGRILANAANQPLNRLPDWLTLEPITGTVSGYSTQTIAVTFDTAGLQPGEYSARVAFISNDHATPYLPMTFTLQTSPSETMGKITGIVQDAWSGIPLTATVTLEGVYTQQAAPTYEIWAQAGIYTLQVTSPGYYTLTQPVTVTAGVSSTYNIPLEPLQPLAGGIPEDMTMHLFAGTAHTQTLLLTNNAPMPLEFSLNEIAPLAQRAPIHLNGVRVLYDNYHDFYSPDSHYPMLVEFLTAAGVQIDLLTEPATPQNLAGYDILWVNSSYRLSWSLDELQALSAWLDQGGALLLNGVPDLSTAAPAALYNVAYVDSLCFSGAFMDVAPHFITDGQAYLFMDITCDYLSASPNAEYLLYDYNGFPRMLAETRGEGKMVVTTGEMLRDYQLNQYPDMTFPLRLFAWLAQPAYRDIPWLTTTPISGTVQPRGEQPITLNIDAASLAPGTYTGTLVIEHNALQQHYPLYIPLTLTVDAPQADLTLLPLTQTVTIEPRQTAYYTFTVTNQGDMPDSFDLAVSGVWTTTLSAQTTGLLAVGETYTFTLAVVAPSDVISGTLHTADVMATSTQDDQTQATVQAVTRIFVTPPPIYEIYLPLLFR